MAKARTYLLVPAGGRGEGMGHLTRSLGLARKLRGTCALYTGHLDESAERYLEERVRALPRGRGIALRHTLAPGDRWDLVLLDKRRTSRAELARYGRLGTVVCIDEGGEARAWAPYLVDTLPSVWAARPANVSSAGFLDLPRRKKRTVSSVFGKVLVSFGGEDAAGLTGKLLDAALSAHVLPRTAFTVVEGPLFSRHKWPEGLTVLRGVARLSALIPEYDLLITHFGMAALEALALGVPVVLFNPSEYHRRLGSLMGIPDIGVGRPKMGALAALLTEPRRLGDAVERLEAVISGTRGSGLGLYLSRLSTGTGDVCPVCHAGGNRVAGRFPERTYYACAGCGTVYLQSFAAARRYEARYFSDEYRRQYGRTYLEDFDAIKARGRGRVAILKEACGLRPPGLVMDVGCALGPFLAALAEEGFRPFGVDVSAEAVRHVREERGFAAVRSSFEDLRRTDLPRSQPAALTFWFVLEHVADLHFVFRKAAGLLPGGGALAFSTPNGRGISARKDFPDFLDRSPADHVTILSPRGLGRILREHGLALKRVRVTGHHPERFPGVLGKAAQANRLVGRLLSAASRLLRLGDTFEAYAVKEMHG
jgi:2-polyprenyl-3-methyl-5-hydroxy-6-metoxy-1,4-benzoquinol methylase